MTYPNIADPATWLLGTVTAAEFKANLTDLLNAGELYQAYTPTLTATGTNPTGWTRSGLYVQVGKRVDYEATFTFGSGATVGSGTYFFGLPVPPAQSSILCVGIGTVTANSYVLDAINTTDSGTQSCALFQRFASGAGPRVGNGGPYSNAWSTGNIVRISGTYRAA